jgi:hypothetical protein
MRPPNKFRPEKGQVLDYLRISSGIRILAAAANKLRQEQNSSLILDPPWRQIPEVVCTVRLAIGFLLVLSKWCAQSRRAIGF